MDDQRDYEEEAAVRADMESEAAAEAADADATREAEQLAAWLIHINRGN